ncbi:MAG TPA: isoaspartyl peptidase/L-asparaginase [Anaerolineae bacterium]
MAIAIIVHGGSGKIPLELHAGHVAGCRAAADAGWAILAAGGTALAAVEAAVRVMEDDPVFDAGRGSVLNRDGEVELDAGMMDGRTLRAGAVAGIKRIANPITLARHILQESEHVFLVGSGAERFAEHVGMPFCDPADLVVERERRVWHEWQEGERVPGADFQPEPADTVGAVAVDVDGNLAAANSTGGTAYKWPGRVGDTPIIGCGLYADNQLGAAVCTGWGEQIMKTVLAKTAVDQTNWLVDPMTAAKVVIAYFRNRIGGLGGVICVSPDGRVGHAHSTPYMAYAYRLEDMAQTVAAIGDQPQ